MSGPDPRRSLLPAGASLRPATIADLDVVLRHRRGMFEDMGYGPAAALDAMVEATRGPLSRWLKEGVYRGWLAERAEGVVAGGGILLTSSLPHVDDPQVRRATILNVYTERAHRRRGYGRALMETMVAWCRQEGLPAVRLDASDDGRALYESMGFRPTTEMRLKLSR